LVLPLEIIDVLFLNLGVAKELVGGVGGGIAGTVSPFLCKRSQFSLKLLQPNSAMHTSLPHACRTSTIIVNNPCMPAPLCQSKYIPPRTAAARPNN
jgi:hypothetical protein